MTTLDDFKLDADITVGELRHEEIVDARLKSFNRLRVRRRNDVFAVLVGAEEWQQLTDNVRELEAQVARHEGDEVRQILAERLSEAEFTPATPNIVADIDRVYRNAIGEGGAAPTERSDSLTV